MYQSRAQVAEARVAELEAAVQAAMDELGPGHNEASDSPANRCYAILLDALTDQPLGSMPYFPIVCEAHQNAIRYATVEACPNCRALRQAAVDRHLQGNPDTKESPHGI